MPIIFTNEDYKQPSISGGFGRQVDSTGRPTVIPPIRKIPVTFEEFMNDNEVVEMKAIGDNVS